MNLRKTEGTATQSIHASAASDRPSDQEIAARAYEIFLTRGATPGSDVQDWLQAERELIENSRDSTLLRAMAIK